MVTALLSATVFGIGLPQWAQAQETNPAEMLIDALQLQRLYLGTLHRIVDTHAARDSTVDALRDDVLGVFARHIPWDSAKAVYTAALGRPEYAAAANGLAGFFRTPLGRRVTEALAKSGGRADAAWAYLSTDDRARLDDTVPTAGWTGWLDEIGPGVNEAMAALLHRRLPAIQRELTDLIARRSSPQSP